MYQWVVVFAFLAQTASAETDVDKRTIQEAARRATAILKTWMHPNAKPLITAEPIHIKAMPTSAPLSTKITYVDAEGKLATHAMGVFTKNGFLERLNGNEEASIESMVSVLLHGAVGAHSLIKANPKLAGPGFPKPSAPFYYTVPREDIQFYFPKHRKQEGTWARQQAYTAVLNWLAQKTGTQFGVQSVTTKTDEFSMKYYHHYYDKDAVYVDELELRGPNDDIFHVAVTFNSDDPGPKNWKDQAYDTAMEKFLAALDKESKENPYFSRSIEIDALSKELAASSVHSTGGCSKDSHFLGAKIDPRFFRHFGAN